MRSRRCSRWNRTYCYRRPAGLRSAHPLRLGRARLLRRSTGPGLTPLARAAPRESAACRRALPADGRRVASVEEDALFGEGERGRSGVAGGDELHGRHGHRNDCVPRSHRVAVDEPLAGDDVFVGGLVGLDRPPGGPPRLISVPPAREVEGVVTRARSAEPRDLASRLDHAAKSTLGWGGIGAGDREGSVLGGTCGRGHRRGPLVGGCSMSSARISPSRSRRRSQAAR